MQRLLIGLAWVLAACSTTMTTAEPGDAEKAIQQGNRSFSDAVLRADAAGMASGYAEDAVVMPPNMAAARGRDAIRQLWTGFLSAGKMQLGLTTDRVIQSCDMAAEIGRYSLTITPQAAGAPPVHDVGKYVVNWRKIDGRWQIITDVFNSDQPAR